MSDIVLYDESARLAPRGIVGRFIDRIMPRNIRLNRQLIKTQWQVVGEPDIGGQSPEMMARSYEREAWIYACVSAIAQDISGMPAKIMLGTESVEKPWEAPLSMFENPNPHDSWQDLIFMMVVDLLIFGDAYCFWPGKELLWMPSWQTRPIPDINGRIGGYLVKGVEGADAEFEPNEVIHVRYSGPRNITNGLSPLGPLSDSIKKWALQVETEKALWQNQTRLGGILVSKQVLSPEMRDRELDQWRQNYAGAARAGKVALLSGDISYQPIGMTMAEAGSAESRKEYREAIMAVYHVPPTRLGLPEANYALAREQKMGYWLETVLPTAAKIYSAFNRVIFNKLEFAVEADTSRAIYVTLAQEALIDMALKATGNKPLMSQNEARTRLLRLDAFEGDDNADRLNHELASMGGEFASVSQGNSGLEVNDNRPENTKNLTPMQRSQIAEINARAFEKRKRRHAANVRKETGICKRDVATPLIEIIEKTNMAALRAAKNLERSYLKEHGRHLTVAECLGLRQVDQVDPRPMPKLPDGADFQEQAETLLGGYLVGAFARVGGAEKLNAEKQKRSLRNVWTRAEDFEAELEGFDIKNPRVQELIRQRTQEFKTVPLGLQEKIRELIARSVEQGKSLDELVRDIQGYFNMIKTWQVARISRTEGAMATNIAANEAMVQARATKKVWIHSGNPAGRETHIEAERMGEVPFNAIYRNGLKHPMDPSGPPEEIINCQCTHAVTEFEDITSTAPRPGQTLPIGGYQ